ncbi:hypothetical protein H0B56_00560 [Haloechinothrix sp. YIM 98757]|uniref:Uncharacterized protein n=1 Tax=Haloechinothrix aidingensis TaxID=2752311 RepID=A0A838A7D9_9PSEU|nr:hypothetical protein [Haloechinothrix aidingensis]MBA0124032.1 hypothetical protein [Haloechinothrix aidingensis]
MPVRRSLVATANAGADDRDRGPAPTAGSVSAYRLVRTSGAGRAAARAPRLGQDDTHQPQATGLPAKYIRGDTLDSGTGAIRLRVPVADVPGFT